MVGCKPDTSRPETAMAARRSMGRHAGLEPLMLRFVLVLCCVLCSAPAQGLDAARFARDLQAIVPRAEELDWRAIPWQAELRTALVEASRLQKPVLLWAMNGHPLGQT